MCTYSSFNITHTPVDFYTQHFIQYIISKGIHVSCEQGKNKTSTAATSAEVISARLASDWHIPGFICTPVLHRTAPQSICWCQLNMCIPYHIGHLTLSMGEPSSLIRTHWTLQETFSLQHSTLEATLIDWTSSLIVCCSARQPFRCQQGLLH